jgi:hypothetical protein
VALHAFHWIVWILGPHRLKTNVEQVDCCMEKFETEKHGIDNIHFVFPAMDVSSKHEDQYDVHCTINISLQKLHHDWPSIRVLCQRGDLTVFGDLLEPKYFKTNLRYVRTKDLQEIEEKAKERTKELTVMMNEQLKVRHWLLLRTKKLFCWEWLIERGELVRCSCFLGQEIQRAGARFRRGSQSFVDHSP